MISAISQYKVHVCSAIHNWSPHQSAQEEGSWLRLHMAPAVQAQVSGSGRRSPRHPRTRSAPAAKEGLLSGRQASPVASCYANSCCLLPQSSFSCLQCCSMPNPHHLNNNISRYQNILTPSLLVWKWSWYMRICLFSSFFWTNLIFNY